MVKRTEPVAGRKPKTKVPLNLQGINGRPPKLTAEQKSEVFDVFAEYIVSTDDPTVSDFVTSQTICYRYNILSHDIYHWKEFSQLVKRATQKQEAYLLKQGGAGKYNPTLAIFRLKQPQHGYKDRTETDVTSGGEKLMGVGVSADQAEQLIRARAKRSDI